MDKCCYMLYDENAQVVIVRILHVDDILMGVRKESQITVNFVTR